MHTNRFCYLNNKALVWLHRALIWKLKAAVGEYGALHRTPEAPEPRGSQCSCTRRLACHLGITNVPIFTTTFSFLESLHNKMATASRFKAQLGLFCFITFSLISTSHSFVSYFAVKWLSINCNSFSYAFSHQQLHLWLEAFQNASETNTFLTKAFLQSKM